MWLHAFITNSLVKFNFKRTSFVYNDTVTSSFYLFSLYVLYFSYFTQVRSDKWIVKSVAKTMTAIFRNLQRQCLPVKSLLSTCQVTKEPSPALLEGLQNHGLFSRIMCTKTDSNEKDKSYIYINNKMSSEAIENSAWVCWRE